MSFEPPPTPAPLLEIVTVASSKLQEEAADTMAAPESKREETKPWRTLIVADSERVNAELSTLRRHRRKRVLCQDFWRHVPALVLHALPQLGYYRLSAPIIIATRMLGHLLFLFSSK